MWVQELTFKPKNNKWKALKQGKINSPSIHLYNLQSIIKGDVFPKLGYRNFWKLKRDWDGEDEEDAYLSFSLILEQELELPKKTRV